MTTQTTRKYWQKRQLQEKQRQIDNTTDYELALRARMQDLEHEIEKETNKFLIRYAAENDITVESAKKILKTVNTTNWQMTLAEFEAKARKGGYDKELNSEYYKSRIARLQDIHEQLMELGAKFAGQESEKMKQSLANQFDDTYLHQNYYHQSATGTLGVDFTHFNEAQVKQIISKPWQGSNFSKRIWKNYQQTLPDQLTDALLRGTLLGYSSDKVTGMLRQRFKDVTDHQIHRLVVTEMGHVAEEATATFYEESEIEQYEYLATLETHTCEECGHLDGRIFNVKDREEGINYPLIHPYCRCTTVPYEKDLPDVESRWARNPETGKGEYVDDMSFETWKKAIHQQEVGKKLTNTAERFTTNGKYNWNELNAEQYNKHVKDTPEFNNYVKGRKNPVSELIISPKETQALIYKYGKKRESTDKKQILFKHDSYIGKWADINGNTYPTKNGRISYRKNKGAHITPRKPDYLN